MMGCITVTAAGNDGETNTLPKMCSGWRNIAVGSVDAYDRIAEFSNYTPWTSTDFLLVYAPGVDLYGPIGAPYDHSMGTWSGTSFSAGYISGAAALVLERHPGFGPGEMMQILGDSVVPIVDRDGNPVPNAGRIDLVRAVSR